MTTGPPRNLSVDALRVALSLMVVALHAQLLMDVSEPLGDFLRDYLFRIAVPLFFMVSGYYFADRIASRARVVAWARRILLLYLVWTVIYLPWIVGPEVRWRSIARHLVLGYYHLWYLPAVLLAGVCLHLLKNVSTRQLLALAATCYLTGCVIQYAGNYGWLAGRPIDSLLRLYDSHRNFLLFGFPMFSIGYLAAKSSPHALARFSTPLVLLGSAGLGVEFLVNRRFGITSTTHFDLLLALPVLCTGILLLVMRIDLVGRVAWLPAVSSIVYLVHPLFLLWLWRHAPELSTASVTAAAIAGSLCLVPILIALARRWPQAALF